MKNIEGRNKHKHLEKTRENSSSSFAGSDILQNYSSYVTSRRKELRGTSLHESYVTPDLQRDRQLIEENGWSEIVQLIAKPDRTSNCFGKALADGRMHLSETDVIQILKDDYRQVDPQKHQLKRGDVVIWKDMEYGTLEHGGRISATTPELRVESQWEAGGATWDHPLYALPPEYGSSHEFYRKKTERN